MWTLRSFIGDSENILQILLYTFNDFLNNNNTPLFVSVFCNYNALLLVVSGPPGYSGMSFCNNTALVSLPSFFTLNIQILIKKKSFPIHQIRSILWVHSLCLGIGELHDTRRETHAFSSSAVNSSALRMPMRDITAITAVVLA